jgi:hypothetical protein
VINGNYDRLFIMIYEFLTGRSETETGTIEQPNDECRSLVKRIPDSE